MNTEKILNYISYLIKFILILAIVYDAVTLHYSELFITCLTLILLTYPYFLKKKYNLIMPIEIEFLITFFIFGTLYLGEIHDFYLKFTYWDVYLHTLSGFLLGLLGFVIVNSIISSNDKNKLTPLFFALFTFSFAVMIGVIWEVFEFFMDQVFGMNMQKSGLVDTMWDLIVDSLGALVVAISSYFYIKRKSPKGVIYNLIDKLVTKKR